MEQVCDEHRIPRNTVGCGSAPESIQLIFFQITPHKVLWVPTQADNKKTCASRQLQIYAMILHCIYTDTVLLGL
jgi:hypothetical protein